MIPQRLLHRHRASPAGSGYAHAPLPSGRTPWREAPWCAVDLELSGLDSKHHEIIAFGAVPIEHGRVILQGAVSGLVHPQRALSESSIRVHGMRAADLSDAPPLPEAIAPLLGAMAGRGLIVHAAAIERGFLGPALRAHGVRLRGPLIDTVTLGQLWLAARDGSIPPRHLSLAGLAGALTLPADRQHAALSDALTTAQVFIALATHLDASAPETVRSLSRASSRLDSLRAYPVKVSA